VGKKQVANSGVLSVSLLQLNVFIYGYLYLPATTWPLRVSGTSESVPISTDNWFHLPQSC